MSEKKIDTKRLKVGEILRDGYVDGMAFTIDDTRGHLIAEFARKGRNPRTKANADEMVRRWNSYPAMLAACEKVLEAFNKGIRINQKVCMTAGLMIAIDKDLQRAIKKAKR